MANFSVKNEFVQRSVEKSMHEEFVKNLNGTTIEETFLTLYSAPLFSFISIVFVNRLVPKLLYQDTLLLAPLFRGLLLFLVELFLIIVPLILTYTVLSEYVGLTLFVCLFLSFYIIVIHVSVPEGGTLYWNKPNLTDILSVTIKGQNRSYITNFRSLINVITAICILAVDFNIFPRRFAKTETFGYGLMDIGVGMFVVSNSIILKSHSQGNKLQIIWNTLLGSSVLFLLGLIRYFTISQINYQTHITEYGVHWNFFFTLALTQLLSRAILLSEALFRKCYLISAFLIIFHQLTLFYGLQDWVLNETSRNTWMDANKEGLVSLTGYVGLYLAGVAIGNFITSKRPTVKSELKLIGKLILFTIIFYCITLYLNTVFPASRRLVNITYVTWVVGVCILILSICNFIEILSKCLLKNMSNKESDNFVPVILESVSYNGLPFFLLANIMTGLVNITFMTISMEVLSSLCVLFGYMVLLCGITEILYYNHLKIKFW